jgi:hypothetical protein
MSKFKTYVLCPKFRTGGTRDSCCEETGTIHTCGRWKVRHDSSELSCGRLSSSFCGSVRFVTALVALMMLGRSKRQRASTHPWGQRWLHDRTEAMVPCDLRPGPHGVRASASAGYCAAIDELRPGS